MNEKELRKMSLNEATMKAIWFPPEAHEFISSKAKEEGLPMYKYLLMCSHNYEIKNKDEEYKQGL